MLLPNCPTSLWSVYSFELADKNGIEGVAAFEASATIKNAAAEGNPMLTNCAAPLLSVAVESLEYGNAMPPTWVAV